MNPVIKALNFRHACKAFDPWKKISKVHLDMILTAASEEIDTCPIEGFEKDWVEKVLHIDTQEYEVAVIVALGYRMKEQPPRRRHPMDQTVEYR